MLWLCLVCSFSPQGSYFTFPGKKNTFNFLPSHSPRPAVITSTSHNPLEVKWGPWQQLLHPPPQTCDADVKSYSPPSAGDVCAASQILTPRYFMCLRVHLLFTFSRMYAFIHVMVLFTCKLTSFFCSFCVCRGYKMAAERLLIIYMGPTFPRGCGLVAITVVKPALGDYHAVSSSRHRLDPSSADCI